MRIRETTGTPPAAPPARPGLAWPPVAPPDAGPSDEMFMRPPRSWISATWGFSSTSSLNSTRPDSSGHTRSRKLPVATVRNGLAPKRGSSAIWRSFSLTAGSGNTETDTDANVTGRPSACVTVCEISACTRGVSTTYGMATAAAMTRTRMAATAAATHFSMRRSGPGD